MAVKTYAEQLEDVQTAIAAIESGAQSQSMQNRSITRADLSTLYLREKWLRVMVDRETSGGIGVNYVIYS